VALTGLHLDAFTERLASADPTPGGGSASAAVGALGASLLCMVARLTAQSPKHAGVAAQCREVETAADSLRRAFLELVERDAAAFDLVSSAYRLPRGSDEEKAARRAAVQSALHEAMQPPRQIIAHARSVCDLALTLADIGAPAAASDVGCAALFASAAAHGALLNVEINARALRDREVALSSLREANSIVAHVDVLAEVLAGKLSPDLEAPAS
jgi:formiminotetrahydrofolate cyclodeaminase